MFCSVDSKLREPGLNHKHSQAKLYPYWSHNFGFTLCPQRMWATSLLAMVEKGLPCPISFSSASNQTLSPFQLSWSPPRGLLSRSFINQCHRQLWHWIASSRTTRRKPKANRQEGAIKQTLDCGEGKLCFLLNQLGLVVSWDCDRANVYEGLAFQHLVGGCRFNNGCLFGYRLGEERLASHKLTHLKRWRMECQDADLHLWFQAFPSSGLAIF